MRLEFATQKDFETIIAFYDDVTERTPEMGTYARWQKGKHPTEEGISAYINEGSMYIYRERGVIVGAMAVTMYRGKQHLYAENTGWTDFYFFEYKSDNTNL